MAAKRLRQQIAFVAARLLHDHEETEYVRAKRRAARKLGFRFRPTDLPSNREVRDHLRRITEQFEKGLPEGRPRQLRIEALRWMRLLADFAPLLAGDVASGDTEPGAAIELLLIADDPERVVSLLDPNQPVQRVDDSQSSGAYAALLVAGPPLCRLHLFHSRDWAIRPKGMDMDQLEQTLRTERPDGDLEEELQGLDPHADRFEIYRDLLHMLEDIKQDPDLHPEGDALYHSLQMFDLAVNVRGYDEEFVTAALLHDVGKSVTAAEPSAETVELLEGIVTHRTQWLIAHHPLGQMYRSGELPAEERQQLRASEDFDDLMLLCELDEQARRSGVETSTIDEAIDYLRRLDAGEYV